MSIKSRKGGIKTEYERALKAAKERRRYYIKKSGGLYLPEIKRTKKPTRGSIRALEKMFRGGEKAVYKREAARQRREYRKQMKRSREELPTIQAAVKNRIVEIIEEARTEADQFLYDSRGNWINYKIEQLEKRMAEHHITYEQLEKAIPPIDADLERFLYDSGNRAGDRYKEFLNKIDSIVFGENALPASVEYDLTNDYEGMLDESFDW